MNVGPQNLFSQQQSPLRPGRIVTKVKRYVSPSGKVVELRWVTVTIQDDQGIWRTEETMEAVPPLCDGSVLSEANYDNLQECVRCLGITVQAYQCPKCCRWMCMLCTAEVAMHGKERRFCTDCAWKINYPRLSRLGKLIWG